MSVRIREKRAKLSVLVSWLIERPLLRQVGASKMSKMSKTVPVKTDRKFVALVYPDSSSYDYVTVLKNLRKFPEWAYCLHDKDLKSDGEDTKRHYHCIMRGRSSKPLQTVANALGIPVQFVDFCNKWDSACRYLIHADDPEKYQYPQTDVVASFDWTQYLVDAPVRMAQKGMEIMNYLCETRCSSPMRLLSWSASSGCYDEVMRHWGAWRDVMRELNNKEL